MSEQLLRKLFKINGVDRALLFDPEKDSLADVLRRFGLTGVKLGCKIGICGACSVLLNGKVVRACTKKMVKVEEFSEIITIEGLGTPMNLHPLQQAFITYGAVQCGFCSPGFIISAYGLLRENPAPSREQVRAWFQQNQNVCRCTGYKPIVDAVMAAARVLRGEATMQDITYTSQGEDIYGSRHPRPTALAKVCGLCDYGDDIKLKMPQSVAHLALVLAEVPHAKIIDIDVSKAEKMPGVIKVLLGKDVKGSNAMGLPSNHPRSRGEGITTQAVIADKKINKVGDCVAVVAADTEEHARAAAKMVEQHLEPLPAYLNGLEAVAPHALNIFSNMPNLHLEQPVIKGEDTRDIIDDAPFSVSGSFSTQREPHMPIEPDVVQGYWDPEGQLTLQCKSQCIHITRFAISGAIGLAPDKIRVIMNPAGGSFGYSCHEGTYAIVATAVQNLDRPCTMTLPYADHQHYTGKRCASFSNGRLACDEKGKLIAAEWDAIADHGAYAGTIDVIMHSFTRMPYHGYHIPNIRGLARACISNNANGVAYRGYGTPQIMTLAESLMDMLARKANIDPFEFRYINVAKPGDLNINSFPYKEYPVKDLMDKARPIYEEFKADAEKARAEGKLRGVGVSQGGFNVGLGSFDSAEVALELNADGSITHYNTWQDVGQGGDIGTLTHTVKALAPLGIKPEQVRLKMNDTKFCPDTGISAASRSHYMSGWATLDAAAKLMNAMRKPDGSYRNYEEMMAEGIPTMYVGRHDLKAENLSEPDPNTGVGDRTSTYMYCVNLAEVEVDPASGKTTVLRMAVVADVGVLGNKLSVDGQALGGLSHCIGFALSEDYSDPQKHTNIKACGVPYALQVPDDIQVLYIENPRVHGPHGSSGCSENFQATAHVAVLNGLYDAAGVRICNLPATPDKVKAALAAREQGAAEEPELYFLGSDFYEEMEDIINNPV